MGSFGICFVSLLLGVPFVWIQFDVMRLCEMRLARISFDLSGSFPSQGRTKMATDVESVWGR